jgi:CRP-like cAMP-binding protein
MAPPSRSASDSALIIPFPFTERSPWRLARPLPPQATAAFQSGATPVKFKKGEAIYRAGMRGDFLYGVVSGFAKTFFPVLTGRQCIMGFRFPGDLMGLHTDGVYLNSAEAISQLVVYKFSVAHYEAMLRAHSALAPQLATKLMHDIAEHQHHAYILSRNDALGRIGMFIEMLAATKSLRLAADGAIHVPMSRSDIANYLGITRESLSRGLAVLKGRKIVASPTLKRLAILSRKGLADLVAGPGSAPARAMEPARQAD